MIALATPIDAVAAPSGNESPPSSHHPVASSLSSGDAGGFSCVVATHVRQCPRCRVWVPAGCFRLHSRKDGTNCRLAICDECRWNAERERRLKSAETQRRKAMHTAWSEICRTKQQRRSIQNIVGRLWDSLGGSAGIAAGWAEALRQGSAAQRIRSYEGLVRLTEWLAENPEIYTDAGAMTDAEIIAEARNARAAVAVELFQRDPETAAVIAEKFGYLRTDDGDAKC